mgnify:CR=1 FL=1
MRTVQQYYDDNRDKILFDVRALEEYEKETIEASIHYYWEDMIKVLEDNKEEFEAKYSKDTPIYILCYTGQKSEEIEDILDEMGYEAYSLDGGFVAYLRWKFNKYLEQDKESGNNTSEENVKEIERSIVKKFRKPIWRKFTQALNEYDLIQDGDKIAVCISGGKDSMLMAKLFQELKRHGKNNFELVFLVMNPGYNDLNYNVILNNAKILDIPITVFKTEIFDTVVDITESPCYLCARMRRGYLYSKAKELGCNKIALGHHYDDVIETILMGMLYGAQVQTMMPKLHSTNFEGMELIRPMYLIREADIIHWKEYNNLEFIQCACRFTEGCASCGGTGKGSKRAEIKQLIKDLTKVSPYIEKNIFRSVENVNIDTVIAYKKKGQRHSFLDEYDITDDKYAGNAEVDNSENTSKELNKSDINSSGQLSEYHTDETIELGKTGSTQIMPLNKSDINKYDISENTLAKYEKLKSIIKDCGKIAIAFSIDGTGEMKNIGAESIIIYYKIGGAWVVGDDLDRYDSGMSTKDDYYFGNELYYTGTPGKEYKVEVTVFAENSSGYDSRTRTFNVTA